MKIYFAASIRGGRDDVDIYIKLIEHLKQYGEVLTEHVGERGLTPQGEKNVSEEFIHNRDMAWLLQTNIVVAEVTNPSLGVGYELGRAMMDKKPILCLYRPQKGKRLSAMVGGCNSITTRNYKTIDEAKKCIDDFFKTKMQ